MTGTKKSILFIGGSMNQTTQMHQIADELPECGSWFSPIYVDGFLEILRKAYLLEPTILGNRQFRRCLSYLEKQNLQIDLRGVDRQYDLIVLPSDLVVPRNIKGSRTLLLQEGMTDPEGFRYRLIKTFPFLPRWITSTAATGLSDVYDVFCVASEGYRNLFVRKGVRPEKIIVTGIPNFDNCKKYLVNDFPYKNYVLVCTSDTRETWGFENRKKTIHNAVRIADGRQLIFRLHPNETIERATREINRYAPGALVFPTGKTEEMIANCDVLITRFSSTVYVGLALGKEVYSEFDVNELRQLTPLQNASAAKNIAAVCRELINIGPRRESPLLSKRKRSRGFTKRKTYGKYLRSLAHT
jgi:hypothetical protein